MANDLAGRAKALLLLTAKDGTKPPGMTDLRSSAEGVIDRVGDQVEQIKVGLGIPAGTPGMAEYDEIIEQGLSNGVRLGGFHAVLEATLRALPDEAMVSSIFKGIGTSLNDAVESTRSIVAVGTAVTIIEGTGPLQLVYCMRRVPEITHEQFSDYWVNEHVKVSKLTPSIIAYYQLHVDPKLSNAGASGADVGLSDIDGIALESFEDMEGFLKCVRPDPSFAKAARTSEQNVNDLNRVTAILTETSMVYP